MRTLAILATGLGQGRISNGMRTLAARLEQLDDRLGINYLVCSWKDFPNVADRALNILKWEARGLRPCSIYLVGHSWGVWYCCQLAAELEKVAPSLKIDCLFSADGVNRPPKGTLTIPPNVRELRSWYQTEGIIRGSVIEWRDDVTKLTYHEQVFVRHPAVDEVETFQSQTFAKISGLQ